MAACDQSRQRIRERLRKRRIQQSLWPLDDVDDVVSPDSGSNARPPKPPKHTYTDLDPYEEDFRIRLLDVRLIGELNLSYEEFEELSTALHKYRGVMSPASKVESIKSQYPVLFAVFLVFCGVYDYAAGDYWGAVGRRLGISSVSGGPGSAELGRFFESFIDRNNLETFDQFPEHALRYVARILAHGGIPSYCLPDFFSLLDYTLRRPEWASLTPAIVIDEWRAHRYSFLAIDVPIRRFLNHGGAVAEDFLQRSLDMASETIDRNVPPAENRSGLPPRIVEGFSTWLADEPHVALSSAIARTRLSPPEILLDPWSRDGLIVQLRSQVLTQSSAQAEWVIQGDTQPEVIRVSGFPREGKWVLEAATAQLRRASARYDISLRVDGLELGAWTFTGVGNARPVMAFDPRSGGLIRWTGALPARDLWLLMPGSGLGANVSVYDRSGAQLDHAVIEELPNMVAGWQGFSVRHVDLSTGRHLKVEGAQSTGAMGAIPIAVDEGEGRPKFNYQEFEVVGADASDNHLPTLSKAPTVTVPITEADHSFRPELWSVSISPHRGSVPSEEIRESAVDLVWFDTADNTVQFDLHQERLLPSSATGTFSCTLRGPLGRDARFDFGVIPDLRIEGRENPLQLTNDADRAASFRIAASCPLHVTASSPDTVLEPVRNHYQISTSQPEVLLMVSPGLEHPLGVGDGSRIALTVSVPILRWALLGFEQRQTLKWSSRPLMLSRTDLDAADEPAILIDGFRVKTGYSLPEGSGFATLSLRTLTGDTIHHEDTKVRGDRVWLPLSTFRDSIRSHPAAGLEFVLDIWDGAKRHILVEVPILRITQTLTVDRFTIVEDWISPDGLDRTLTVRWNETRNITDRNILIWSLTRLWDEPVSIAVPDDAQGMLTFSVSVDNLPVGRYRFDMIVVDPWAMGSSVLSMPLSPSDTSGQRRGLLDAEIGTSLELAAYLNHAPNSIAMLIAQSHAGENPSSLAQLPLFLTPDNLEEALVIFERLLSAKGREVLQDRRWIEEASTHLQVALASHPALLKTLAHHLSTGGGVGDAGGEQSNRRFVALIAALGIPQTAPQNLAMAPDCASESERTALERQFPPLFSSTVDRDVSALARRQDVAELLLGRVGLELLLPSILEENDDWQSPGDARSASALDILDSFGRTVHAANYELSAQRLVMIRTALNLLPQGLLDADAFDIANFEWLISLRQPSKVENRKKQVETWIDEVRPRLMSTLGSVAPRSHRLGARQEGLHLCLQILEKRMSGSYDGIAWIPYIVGATALLQRLTARETLGIDTRLSSTVLLGWGQTVASVAPSLYVRDLALFDLLLLRSID